jgi:hypothetical protein
MRKKKIVIFVLPIIYLFILASGLNAEEKPMTIQELFDDLPYNLTFHDSMGKEYHLTYSGTWGNCDTYVGYSWYTPAMPYAYPETYLWFYANRWEFGITGQSHSAYYGFCILGDGWTENTYILTWGYHAADIQFFKGPVPVGFQRTSKADDGSY